MTVWIVNPFDNLPLEGYRPQRYWLMAQAFAAAGHDVVYWTSDFSHANKAPRRVDGLVKESSGCCSVRAAAVTVKLVPTPPYARNVSFARVRSHRCLAANWLACARREARRPDIVIASLPPVRLPRVALAYARAVGAKFVVDIMDDWPGTFYRLLPRGLRALGPVLFAGMRRAARQIYAGADLVTGCSDRYGALARAAGAKGFYRAYHGIELGPAPVPRALRRPGALSLLYLGNLGRTYGLETVLAAVARMEDVTLDVAGAGAQEGLLKACRSPRVRFHGYCGAAELEALLAQADVGLVPMKPESCVGVPYKLADYARAGLAIASSLGGESGALLARCGAGEAYADGDPASLVAALGRLRARLDAAKAAARRLAETAFDARRIYAAYVARVTGAHRVAVKVCGVNDAAFAQAAERLGADYLGLIFAAGSPRRVTVEQARGILAGLVGTAEPVGVFTSAPVPEIAETARALGLRTVQLHRRAAAADVAALKAQGFTVWALAGGAPADALLFDSSHGDGETALRKGPWRTVLAGGVSADNVRAACASGADVVDVSGSLESAPGVKSVAKLAAFMSAADAARDL